MIGFIGSLALHERLHEVVLEEVCGGKLCAILAMVLTQAGWSA